MQVRAGLLFTTLLASVFSGLAGCPFDPEPPTQAGTDTDTPTSGGPGTESLTNGTTMTTVDPDSSGTTGDDPTTLTDTETDECSTVDGPDPACSGATPYCSSGMCVGCDAIECSTADPSNPVCDSSGSCIECTAETPDACFATQSACVDNECVPCTTNAQCPGNVCLMDSGQCLLEEVSVQGIVYDYSTIARDPVGEVTVQITNLDEAPTAEATAADGAYALGGLVPGTSLDLQLMYEQDDPVFVPATLSARLSYTVPNATPAPLDLPLVRYNWMAKVAFECGLFATLEEAVGEVSVNPYFIQRSTLFGQLVDDDGEGVATVSRAAISALMGDWANLHDNIVDQDDNPTQVCFLDEDAASGTYVGTSAAVSNETGRFVMFRLRNFDGLGQGALQVVASGFDDTYTTLSSSGNIGVVELTRNDDPIPRDFAIDIYPIFTTYGCIGCHTEGGPPIIDEEFQANWSLTPREVWENLTGYGVECEVGDPEGPKRICTNQDDDPGLLGPESSLFITRPLTDEVGMPDVHPVDIFPSIDDPTVQVMLEWLEQGALPPAAIRFTEDIYPIFAKHACIACHTDGGPVDAVSNGFEADWSLGPEQVYNNLVGPGTTCPDPNAPVRICTDNPLISKFVTYPLTDDPAMPDDHPVNAFASTSHPDMQLIIQWIAQGADFETTCEHDGCSQDVPLVPGCSDCATEVCNADAYCCTTAWDDACVTAAGNTPSCGC